MIGDCVALKSLIIDPRSAIEHYPDKHKVNAFLIYSSSQLMEENT